MTYTWWIHPKRTTATMRRVQLRMTLLRSRQSTDLSDAVLNHAVEKAAIPAQEKIILRVTPKTTNTPLSQLLNRMNGRVRESALMNKTLTRTRRTVITFRLPSMR